MTWATWSAARATWARPRCLNFCTKESIAATWKVRGKAPRWVRGRPAAGGAGARHMAGIHPTGRAARWNGRLAIQAPRARLRSAISRPVSADLTQRLTTAAPASERVIGYDLA